MKYVLGCLLFLSSCITVKNAPSIRYKQDGTSIVIPPKEPGRFSIDNNGDSVYIEGKDTFAMYHG